MFFLIFLFSEKGKSEDWKAQMKERKSAKHREKQERLQPIGASAEKIEHEDKSSKGKRQ